MPHQAQRNKTFLRQLSKVIENPSKPTIEPKSTGLPTTKVTAPKVSPKVINTNKLLTEVTVNGPVTLNEGPTKTTSKNVAPKLHIPPNILIESKYEKNVLFFKDAASAFGDNEAYTKELIKVCGSEEKLYRELANQIHVESKIIEKKFSSVQMSIRFFALSFFFIILFLLIWLFQM